MLNRIFLILAVFVIHTEGHAASFIIRGEEVSKNDPIARHLVLVMRNQRDYFSGTTQQFYCSGTLIGPGLILTAAHCVGRDQLQVIFGVEQFAKKAAHPRVKGYEIHPLYDTHDGTQLSDYDVAVIRFAGPIPAGYEPAPLLPSDMKLSAGDQLLVAGYGSTSTAKSPKGVGRLRKTRVTVTDPADGFSEMTVDQSHGTGVCTGDSGGPAFFEKDGHLFLAGVIDRVAAPKNNSKLDSCDYIATFANVPYHAAWIAEKLGR